MEEKKLPVVIVTGASGVVGSHFIDSVRDRFKIYAVARRSMAASGMEVHPNVKWLRADIGSASSLEKAFSRVERADYVFHFAAYYDFDNIYKNEYKKTNIDGTENLLKMSCRLGIRRFIYASSLTVTDFRKSVVLNENSPCDAIFPYAKSKKAGELLVRAYSDKFPCTIARLGAIYSDFCEYGPLYVFLKVWLSGRPDSSFLAGRGRTAVPYLHVDDFADLCIKITEKTDELPAFHTVLASSDGCTSHRDLFRIATKYYYGTPKRPVFIPVKLAAVGVAFRQVYGKLRSRHPFERFWMLRYVDSLMKADSAETQKLLNWSPKPRLDIRRRLLFLIENMKSKPFEWGRKNQEALDKRYEDRPGYKIYEAMERGREDIILEKLRLLHERGSDFPNYLLRSDEELYAQIGFTYSMIESCVLYGDRRHILIYAGSVGVERFNQGYPLSEIICSMRVTAEIMVQHLKKDPLCAGLKQRIYDEVMVTAQMIMDEIEDVYYKKSGRKTGCFC
jgi:nucleoside-diphosphate-sugar epimerase